MQRLFSFFPDGAPGTALLSMRVAASAYLALHGVSIVWPSVADVPRFAVVLSLLCAVAAFLLLLGLWTPVSGVLAACAAVWHCVTISSGLGADVLLGVLGVALSLLGPGAYSLDARLFGWKRLEIPSGPPDDWQA